MGEDRQKKIVLLLMINAVLICFFGISISKQIRQINTKNDMLAGQIKDIKNSIGYLDNRISNTINELNDRYNLVEKVDYKFTHIDSAGKKAVLDITAKLKAVKSNSKIYLSYCDVDSDNIQEVELAKKDGLTYGTYIELDMQNNYVYDIIERTEDGGEALLNTNRGTLYLYNELYDRRIQFHSSGSVREKEQSNFDFVFSVNDFGLDEFGLDSVMLELLYEDKVIDEIDITDSISEYNYGIGLINEQYRLAVASGEIEPDTDIEEFKKTVRPVSEGTDDPRKYYTYTHRINYSTDYPELQLDSDKAGNINYNLIITCRDGYRFEWK